MSRTPDQILLAATETFKQRFPIYGKNTTKIGGAMAALFPEGIMLRTPDDFARFYLLMMVVVKLSRYVNNMFKGGHADSLTDSAVYAAMLQWLDEDANHAASK